MLTIIGLKNGFVEVNPFVNYLFLDNSFFFASMVFLLVKLASVYLLFLLLFIFRFKRLSGVLLFIYLGLSLFVVVWNTTILTQNL